ncbi:hypothetical protein KOXY103107_05270 [Komagataeibacter xylinus]
MDEAVKAILPHIHNPPVARSQYELAPACVHRSW